MPTSKQVETNLEQIAEVIGSVGDEVNEIIGPMEREEDESEEVEKIYYLYGETEGSSFYIGASTAVEHMGISYPYSVDRHLARLVSDDEKQRLAESEADFDSLEGEEYNVALQQIGEKIIENTPEQIFRQAKFNIAAYGSSDLVDITFEGGLNAFRATRPVYPYNEPITLREVNDRIVSVVNLGKRSKRYIESSIHITNYESDDEKRIGFNILY